MQKSLMIPQTEKGRQLLGDKTPGWPLKWSVSRRAFGGNYWESAEYGPMRLPEARDMTASLYGGHATRTGR